MFIARIAGNCSKGKVHQCLVGDANIFCVFFLANFHFGEILFIFFVRNISAKPNLRWIIFWWFLVVFFCLASLEIPCFAPPSVDPPLSPTILPIFRRNFFDIEGILLAKCKGSWFPNLPSLPIFEARYFRSRFSFALLRRRNFPLRSIVGI